MFISLDLMLYYGFWELSLVPMAILIAMYGRKDGPKAALKFFLFTFIPSAPLLVAILWLYARTGSFDFVHAADFACAWELLDCGAVLGGAGVPVCLCGEGSGVSAARLAGRHLQRSAGSAGDGCGRASLGCTRCCAFTLGSSLCRRGRLRPYLIALAVIGILYGACLALVQRDFWKLMAFAALSHLSLIVLGIYGLTFTGWTGAVYQILNHGVVDAALFLLLGALEVRYATSQIDAYGGLAAKMPRTATLFCDCVAGNDWAADAGRVCGRVPDSVEHVCAGEQGLGRCGGAGRDSGRGLHAVAGAADFLRAREQVGHVETC